MGEARRTVIVHAFDKPGLPGKVEFSMSGYGVRGDAIHCRKDKARRRMKQSDHHVIVFELANRSAIDLRFPENPDDAMWVAPDDQTCPEDTPMHQKEVVFATGVSTDGEQLTVRNNNQRKKRFKFALNFHEVRDGQTKLHQFDPIWANNNGGDAS